MPQLPDDSMLPAWAVAKAHASLKIGLSVPEIEQRLVAQGLSPLTAAAVVNSILESRLRETLAPREQSDSQTQRHVVHTLKSSSASVGALKLARLCADTENKLREGLSDGLAPQLDELAGEGERVLATLRTA